METSSSKKRPAPEDLDQHQPPHKKPSIVYREPSIFGTKPVDDVTRYIANFIAQHVNQENVEIEAKLGVFVEKRSGQRIDIGAETETSKKSFFSKNMSKEEGETNRLFDSYTSRLSSYT
jgi:polynucleotide 5'-triphosphatase